MAKTVYLNFGMVAIPAKLQSATNEGLGAFGTRSGRTIEVVEFVDDSQIDVRRYKESYFLSPQDTGVRAFTLFLKAMRQACVVAIAELTYKLDFQGKQELRSVVIRPYNGVMLLQTLHPADKLPAEPEGNNRMESLISDGELNLAFKLIDHYQYYNGKTLKKGGEL